MPPWPEWQAEYIGAIFLGKLLGLWFAFLISIVKKVFFWLGTAVNNLGQLAGRDCTHRNLGNNAHFSISQTP